MKWSTYVNKVDKNVLEALHTMVQRSITALERAIKGEWPPL